MFKIRMMDAPSKISHNLINVLIRVEGTATRPEDVKIEGRDFVVQYTDLSGFRALLDGLFKVEIIVALETVKVSLAVDVKVFIDVVEMSLIYPVSIEDYELEAVEEVHRVLEEAVSVSQYLDRDVMGLATLHGHLDLMSR